jgi:hypothetical protein
MSITLFISNIIIILVLLIIKLLNKYFKPFIFFSRNAPFYITNSYHKSAYLELLDFSKNPSKHFDLQTTSKSIYGFNLVAKHYDLPSLMSGKIYAILIRKKFHGSSNTEIIKGRDFFDLLWFLKNSVKPNLKRLSEMLNTSVSMDFVEKQLDLKVKELINKYKSYFESDLIPLISNPDFIKIYVDNYYEEYLRSKKQLSKNNIK